MNKNQLKQLAARMAQSKYTKAVVAAGATLAAAPSFAVTTFAVLPAAAATELDAVTGLGGDVTLILFGVGVPVLLAVVGWNMLRGGVKKGARI